MGTITENYCDRCLRPTNWLRRVGWAFHIGTMGVDEQFDLCLDCEAALAGVIAEFRGSDPFAPMRKPASGREGGAK